MERESFESQQVDNTFNELLPQKYYTCRIVKWTKEAVYREILKRGGGIVIKLEKWGAMVKKRVLNQEGN